MADQISTFPPGEIQVAAKFADGRYLIASSTEERQIDYAYMGYPRAMEALKVHNHEVFEDGKPSNITIGIGNLYFDYKSEELVFEWFNTEQYGDSYEINEATNKQRLEWAEIVKRIEIDETLKSSLFG